MLEGKPDKRPKLKVIPEEPFKNLVRLFYDLLSRDNSKPTKAEVARDLKEVGGISVESRWGPSLNKTWAEIKEEERLALKVKIETTNFERARIIKEAEATRRKEIARETLERINANRPRDSVSGSPMADLGNSSGKIINSKSKGISDDDTPWNG